MSEEKPGKLFTGKNRLYSRIHFLCRQLISFVDFKGIVYVFGSLRNGKNFSRTSTCVINVRIWSFSDFSAFGVNTDRKSSEYGHFLPSGHKLKKNKEDNFNSIQNVQRKVKKSVHPKLRYSKIAGRQKPDNIYLFKSKNRNTKKRYEICQMLTIKTPERRH